MPKLRCLSVRQPWCELILAGRKQVENRTWRTNARGLLGLHASSNYTDFNGLSDDEIEDYFGSYPRDAVLPYGSVTGVIDVVDCCRFADLPADLRDHEFATNDPANWCWVLAHPRRLAEPFPAKGAAAIFFLDVPGEHLGTELAAAVEQAAVPPRG